MKRKISHAAGSAGVIGAIVTLLTAAGLSVPAGVIAAVATLAGYVYREYVKD